MNGLFIPWCSRRFREEKLFKWQLDQDTPLTDWWRGWYKSINCMSLSFVTLTLISCSCIPRDETDNFVLEQHRRMKRPETYWLHNSLERLMFRLSFETLVFQCQVLLNKISLTASFSCLLIWNEILIKLREPLDYFSISKSTSASFCHQSVHSFTRVFGEKKKVLSAVCSDIMILTSISLSLSLKSQEKRWSLSEEKQFCKKRAMGHHMGIK